MDKQDIYNIGFQGELGAYSEKAIDTLFVEQSINKVPFRTSYAVVDALKKKDIDFGLFPIENSIVGSITHNYDLLMEHKLHILKEITLQSLRWNQMVAILKRCMAHIVKVIVF